MKKNKIPIDAVITWVDGSDKEWQKEKNKYSKLENNSESVNVARFRNWDTLKYALRSIETNMPWINKIFLVTNGQIPDYIDERSKKLKIVFHKDFIPEKYLPTFSSHTIELNLHRIKELSNHFIYFNDDFFVLNTTKENDFFVNDLPCDNAILNIHCVKKDLMIHTISTNDISVINKYFDFKKIIKNKISNWINIKYGFKNNLQNIILMNCPRFPGFKQYHQPLAYTKETFIEVWEKEYNYLNEVCSNKFRMPTDVNQWVMREWQLASGRFHIYPKDNKGVMIDFEKNDENKILNYCINTIRRSKSLIICINDGDTIENFEIIKEKIIYELEKKFKNKASFEKD